jgi:adenylate cyclase
MPANTDPLAVYLAHDRRLALARGAGLPDRARGTALFADVSGFTLLADELATSLGARRGVDELSRRINGLYAALIELVERYDGSVVSFAGDAITCWFDESFEPLILSFELNRQPTQNSKLKTQNSSRRAVACAFAMQSVMGAFPTLGLKVAVTAGAARRFVVGDPQIQLIDVLAGATIARLALGEQLAQVGEVVVDQAIVGQLGEDLSVQSWRHAPSGEAFAVDSGWTRPPEAPPERARALPAGIAGDQLRPWVLPAVYERERSGLGEFLTELRPAVALFLRFTGIEYDDDDGAGARLDDLVRRAQQVLARYAGTLLDVTIGDKGSYLYAVFGVPVAHENDSRRAVQAALELQRLAGAVDGVQPVQIGLNAGTMRVGAYGGMARRTYGVLGDDVNLAARLMQAARPGQILAGERVRAATAAAFLWNALAPLPVKGKRAAIPVFELAGRSAEPGMHLTEPRYTLSMVGRQAELALAVDKLRLARQGRGQILGISAEAGMGKSRLVAEVIRLARENGFTGYGGECQSYGTQSPYLVWHEIGRALFGIEPGQTAEQQRVALEARVAVWAPERRWAVPLLGPALNVSLADNHVTRALEPKDRKGALEALFRDGLVAAARPMQGGLLLVLEDVHWIDALSEALLENVARACADLPVLIVLAYRPAPSGPRLLAQIEGLPHFTSLVLGDLDHAEIEALALARLGQLFPGEARAAPRGLIDRLAQRAQGNPFYVEELLNYLHDRQIDPFAAESLEALELPSSLHSLVLSRIDQLAERQKATLKAASVVGRLFRFAWLHGYYPALGEPVSLKADLDELARLGLTPLDTPEPELTYLFKHVVTQEVAYESLPYATRAKLHEQLALYLENLAGTTGTLLDLLAYHYTRSENRPKQREYLRKAGEAAQAAFANAAAQDYYERLLALVADREESIELRLRLGAVLELLGEWGAAEARYREALALAQSARPGASDAAAQCQRALGALFRQRADYAAARDWFEQARANWAELGDRQGVGRMSGEIGTVYERQGEFATARTFLDESLALARESGDLATAAKLLNTLGNMAWGQGDLAASRPFYVESLALHRELDNQRGIATVLNNQGNLLYVEGDLAEAYALHVESLALRRAMGDKHGIANSLANIAVVAAEQGDYAAARAWHEESLALSRELGDKRGIAIALDNLGEVTAAQGDYATARALHEESLALQEEMGNRLGIVSTLFYLGWLAAEQQDGALAQAHFQNSLALACDIGEKRYTAYSLAGIGVVAMLAAGASALPAGAVHARRAVRLLATAERQLAALNAKMERYVRLQRDRTLAAARAALGAEEFDAAWTEGERLTPEEAVAYATRPAA